MMRAIRDENAVVADAISETYDGYIDFGGHSNVGSIAPFVSTASFTNASGETQLQRQFDLITDDPLHIQASCNSVARGGILSLRLIHMIFPDKIVGSGIPSTLLALQGKLIAHNDEVIAPLMRDFVSS